MEAQLIRIDKNGTKYYEQECTCGKCGGKGSIQHFGHIYGGVCFECGGSGRVLKQWKEYTPEYEAKLIAKAEAKRAKAEAEAKAGAEAHNKEFFAKNGFNENGDCFAVLGNTYDIKDELKALGAKWQGHISHWILPTENPKYNTLKLNVSELFFADYAGRYFWNNWDMNDNTLSKIANAEVDLKRKNSTSDFVGAVGDKIQIEVDHHEIAGSYETQFGSIAIYKFYDKDGNIFVWKTSAYVPNIISTLKGTIKEQSEYRGEKQTILTRCKVA